MSYQKIPGIKSKRIERGDCSERWEKIKPELPDEGVVLDIGAAEGYFLKKMAEETNLLAVGIEKNPKRVEFQKKWLNKNYEGKVISCQCNFGLTLSDNISTTCEWIDTILILSTLHWINNADQILKNLSTMAGKIIIEIPDIDDKKATGQKFMKTVRKYGSEKQYFKEITNRKIRHLGKVKAHTHATRNLWVIEGDVEKNPKRPHVNYSSSSGRKYSIKFINNKFDFYRNNEHIDWKHGINAATLNILNVIFPNNSWWKQKVDASVQRIDKKKIKGDIRLHNLIISRNEFAWIDLNDHGKKSTIYKDIENIGEQDNDVHKENGSLL